MKWPANSGGPEQRQLEPHPVLASASRLAAILIKQVESQDLRAKRATSRRQGRVALKLTLLIAVVHPEVIEHDNVTDLIVPVDDDRASLVGPTRPERDVKRQPSGNS